MSLSSTTSASRASMTRSISSMSWGGLGKVGTEFYCAARRRCRTIGVTSTAGRVTAIARRCARRQANNRLALMQCSSAIAETDAPGTTLRATRSRLKAALCARRRPFVRVT